MALKAMLKARIKQWLLPGVPASAAPGPYGPPNLDTIARLLGLHPDDAYAGQRTALRERTMAALSDCSPANSTPAALTGYVGEAALRFAETLEWLGKSLGELALPHPRVLEIGSNPYFLTLLIAERFPQVEHLGVNYFGAPQPAMETQGITDGRHRLAETRFFHADIEKHTLDSLGQFDVALFCEVLEHLPYDPGWALYNILRRLKPGGHLILSTPNPARMENLVALAERKDTFSDPISGFGIHGRHNREYSARELKAMVEGSGCRLLESTTIDVLPNAYTRAAEAHGYGAYHLLRAVLDGEPRLFRPDWLYRSFAPGQLGQPASLVR